MICKNDGNDKIDPKFNEIFLKKISIECVRNEY